MTDKDRSKKDDATKSPRAPAQSLIDQERADWEGMGQSRHQPEAPPTSTPDGAPTPGANSPAGEQR